MFPAVRLDQVLRILKAARCHIVRPIAAGQIALFFAVAASALSAQQNPAQTTVPIELPVQLLQKVAAGKTPVGTKVQAKLVIATLVRGHVIPEGAILSGEVTESVAKSETLPSRLGLRMDSAQSRTGSASIKVYLTGWYYPVTRPIQEAAGDGPDSLSPSTAASSQRSARDRIRATAVPDLDADPTPLPPASLAQHRQLLKDVVPMRNTDGTVILTSARSNLKLDTTTTYILATDGLVPSK